MKTLFVILLVFCSSCDDKFLSEILNDYRDNSCFIAIETINKDNFIIENDDLYHFMSNNYKLDKIQYQTVMRNKLINHLEIFVDSSNESFIKVPSVESVESNSRKGIEEFIKIYFNNGKVLKKEITQNERTSIINKLFKWNIACKIDDESGYLILLR